jgi:hypothetical protein
MKREWLAPTFTLVYAKALGKHKSRKLSKDARLPALKGISESNLRLGTFALEVAKNDAFIDWVENSDSLYIRYDATSVPCMSIQ